MQSKPYKTISSGIPTLSNYIAEVWKARNLIRSFALRDLKVQYAQTYLGLLWSLIQPLTGLLIFTIFFQKLIKLNVDVPYPVFAFTGIIGWFYFTGLVGQAGTSLMHNQQIIRKINFPRLVLPLAKVASGLVELGISSALLLVVMVISKCHFSFNIIFFPLVVTFNMIAGLSIGIWLSALTIRFRDLHHIIPFLVGFGIWLTPVFYPTTIVPKTYFWIYYFHPIANVISLYRWVFTGTPVDWLQVLSSLAISFLLLVSGLLFFIRNEKRIAEFL